MDLNTLKKAFKPWTLRKGSIWIAILYLVTLTILETYLVLFTLQINKDATLLYVIIGLIALELLATVVLLIGIFVKSRFAVLSWIITVISADAAIASITIYFSTVLVILNTYFFTEIVIDRIYYGIIDVIGVKLCLVVIVWKYYRAASKEGPESLVSVPFSSLKERDNI